MRLPLIPPERLDAPQQPLHADMTAGIESHFKGFVTIAPDGALMGPWNPWIHWPKIGGPIWALTKALSFETNLPRPVREVAILVTGAKFRAAYEIYAHVIAAEQRGLPDAKIATIVAGQRPADLTREEAVAYDIAAALVAGGVLPEITWKQGVAVFGRDGAAELIYLVGLYCLV